MSYGGGREWLSDWGRVEKLLISAVGCKGTAEGGSKTVEATGMIGGGAVAVWKGDWGGQR